MENREMTAYNPENVQVNAPVANKFEMDGFDVSVDMTSAQTALCSIKADSKEEKVRLYNAMNNPDKRLGDCINMQIMAKDLYVELVDCTNEETGEVTRCPRIVIIDAKGVSYQCVSIGIYNALSKIMRVFGAPTWDEPVKLEVKQITKGNRKMLTLNAIA